MSDNQNDDRARLLARRERDGIREDSGFVKAPPMYVDGGELLEVSAEYLAWERRWLDDAWSDLVALAKKRAADPVDESKKVNQH